MDAGLWYLTQQVQKLESECFTAKHKVLAARTMRDVKQAADVHVKSEIRHMPGVRQSTFSLQTAATKQMEGLLDAHLKQIGGCVSIDDMRKMRGKFMAGEWKSLPGDFGTVNTKAERESLRIIGQREVAERTAPVMIIDPSILAPQVELEQEDQSDAPGM